MTQKNLLYCSLVVLLALVCGFKTSAAVLQGAPKTCDSHYEPVAQPATDGKTAVALRIQQQRKKAEVAKAVSDFEKSLNNSDISQCDRRLNNSVELWSSGVHVNSCRDLFSARERADRAASTKAKLANEAIELTYPEARVTLDTANERHTYLLEDVREQWLVRCFVSTEKKQAIKTTRQ